MTGLPSRYATLFAYGFRPFFLLAAGYGITGVALWAADTTGWMLLPIPDDRVGWHIHEMVFGFVGAGLAGFLLTAVPSWTSTTPVTGRRLQALVALWLLARVAAWCTGLVGAAPMTLLSLLFTVAVGAAVARPLWRGADGRHRVFLLLLLGLTGVQAAIHVYWALEDIVQVRALLDVAMGLFLMLILAAMGRISMVIVNQALEADEDEPFVARPPLRRFAIGVLAIFLLVDYLLPYSTTSGWVALAAAAAVLNLLNDWHHRGVWRDPYVQVLPGPSLHGPRFRASGSELSVAALPRQLRPPRLRRGFHRPFRAGRPHHRGPAPYRTRPVRPLAHPGPATVPCRRGGGPDRAPVDGCRRRGTGRLRAFLAALVPGVRLVSEPLLGFSD